MTGISEEIWDKKYRLKTLDGAVIDLTVEDTWKRVATALAKAEKTPELQAKWQEKFFGIMASGKFSPAGRIIAGAGSDRAVTLSNCFVMGTIPDSMGGIFEHLKEAALTMQAGGGIGYDFSTLRPKGSPVVRVGADASGPLSFMDCWDAMCRTVMSAGSRRGAMMATMRCDHPDIVDFITAKADPTRLRMFNLSVLVTDAFMEAVQADAMFDLVHEQPPARGPLEQIVAVDGSGRLDVYRHRTVRARDLWDLILQNTYSHAEPGVIFIDRINRDDNLAYTGETIAATNPCGEKPMHPYDSCLLGSINLAKFVRNAFTNDPKFDLGAMSEVVAVAVRLMDNVIDVNRFPLEKQRNVAHNTRQLGLGVTGLADALAMMGVRYGSQRAVELTREWMRALCLDAYDTSITLAREKGPFPAFDVEGFLGGWNFASRMLPEGMQARIRENGIRNSLLVSIAPTGTISLFAGNVSSGIEPIFATSYTRKVLQPDGSRVEHEVEDWAVAEFHRVMGSKSPLPRSFVTMADLLPSDHVAMQAAAQEWVDSSISKTVNVPEDISFEDFRAVYDLAWDTGCKGCTTYRPNEVTGSVLEVKPTETTAPVEPKPETVDLTIRLPKNTPTVRPKELPGIVYKLKFGSDTIYVTVTDILEGDRRRPFEVFVNSKNPDHYAWTVALTRMVSAIFRRPYDSRFVAQELKEVFDPKGGAWVDGRYIPSVPAAIGGILEQHMARMDSLEVPEVVLEAEPVPPTGAIPTVFCKTCRSSNVKMEAGCMACLDCGDSNCG